jgi:hypothetical protein
VTEQRRERQRGSGSGGVTLRGVGRRVKSGVVCSDSDLQYRTHQDMDRTRRIRSSRVAPDGINAPVSAHWHHRWGWAKRKDRKKTSVRGQQISHFCVLGILRSQKKCEVCEVFCEMETNGIVLLRCRSSGACGPLLQEIWWLLLAPPSDNPVRAVHPSQRRRRRPKRFNKAERPATAENAHAR